MISSHSLKLQNGSLIIRCSLVSYPEHSFLGRKVLLYCKGCSRYILGSTTSGITVETYSFLVGIGKPNFDNTTSWLYHHIGLVGRVFTNAPKDRVSIPGWVIPKFEKRVIDTSLLNTQHYEVRIKVKVEQSTERSSALPYTVVL